MEFLIKGDTHGRFTWMDNGCLDGWNPDNTAIVILGDAGFNYWLNKVDDRLKKEVNEKGFTFYCVRGNHEARPQGVSCGYELEYDSNVHGEVYIQEEYPNIRFFKDWGEYRINDYKVAVIGGAYSVDKWWRLQRAGVYSKTDWGYNNPKKTGWFPSEQLSVEEMQQAQKELGNGVYDFVLTHTCPFSWRPTDLFLSSVDQSTVDTSMEKWLEEMKNLMDWKIWLWAHYHTDRIERPHCEIYYNNIENLDVIYKRWIDYDNTGKLDWYLNKSPNFYMGD